VIPAPSGLLLGRPLLLISEPEPPVLRATAVACQAGLDVPIGSARVGQEQAKSQKVTLSWAACSRIAPVRRLT